MKEKEIVFSEELIGLPSLVFFGDSEALSHMEVPVSLSVHVKAGLAAFFALSPWSQQGRLGEECRTYFGIKTGGSRK